MGWPYREDTVTDYNVIVTEFVIDEDNENEITMEEKAGEAAGYDRVSSEMLRSGKEWQVCSTSSLISSGKATGYLMVDAKPLLYPSIKAKAHGRFAQITAL
ncbi:hypothetical protein EVAR_68206_1 [Eumeta japonica]|uniref:Uncharacterized protein n=1 Tax=Eumeta variegata TaxID=151549 RepID=A0A4C2AC41_EUMVA|nr:hypothetical protein EVAR_68206_1 [Eumeta japonica]